MYYQMIIDEAYANIDSACNGDLEQVLDNVIEELDRGVLRVATQDENGKWITYEWIKKAIVLYLRVKQAKVICGGGDFKFYDKVASKYADYTEAQFREELVRVVPQAMVRKGAFIAPRSVIMPSFVNIGAYVDTGCMIDTWATVGSCAQIGKRVHISGGAGIGGVLEPLQALPTIIEDDCFIGARSEIVEGVVVGKGSVIGMGVFIGQSTKIYNRATKEITYGYVPPYSVVIPGSIPSQDGSHSTYSAIIIKQVDDQTRSKTSINQLLRS